MGRGMGEPAPTQAPQQPYERPRRRNRWGEGNDSGGVRDQLRRTEGIENQEALLDPNNPGAFLPQAGPMAPGGQGSGISLIPSTTDLWMQMEERAKPVRDYLEVHGEELAMLSEKQMVGELLDNVPDAMALTTREIIWEVERWDRAHGNGLRMEDSTLMLLAPTDGDLRAIATSACSGSGASVERTGGYVCLEVSGLTTGWRDEAHGADRGVSVGASFTGTLGFKTHAGPVHFGATLGTDQWSMTLSFGADAHPLFLEKLGSVISAGEQGLRGVLGDAEAQGAASADQIQVAPDHFAALGTAADALSAAYASGQASVQAGVTVIGPGGYTGEGWGSGLPVVVSAGIIVTF